MKSWKDNNMLLRVQESVGPTEVRKEEISLYKDLTRILEVAKNLYEESCEKYRTYGSVGHTQRFNDFARKYKERFGKSFSLQGDIRYAMNPYNNPKPEQSFSKKLEACLNSAEASGKDREEWISEANEVFIQEFTSVSARESRGIYAIILGNLEEALDEIEGIPGLRVAIKTESKEEE